jgi:hypothetical protein
MCGPGAEIELMMEDEQKILHLILKKKYFDKIYNGTKKVEYRDFSKYWQKRIQGKHFTHIHFRLGYAKDAPTMLVQVIDRNVVEYKEDLAYAFDLGEIEESNYPAEEYPYNTEFSGDMTEEEMEKIDRRNKNDE